jgi:hypothetical protein
VKQDELALALDERRATTGTKTTAKHSAAEAAAGAKDRNGRSGCGRAGPKTSETQQGNRANQFAAEADGVTHNQAANHST